MECITYTSCVFYYDGSFVKKKKKKGSYDNRTKKAQVKYTSDCKIEIAGLCIENLIVFSPVKIVKSIDMQK